MGCTDCYCAPPSDELGLARAKIVELEHLLAEAREEARNTAAVRAENFALRDQVATLQATNERRFDELVSYQNEVDALRRELAKANEAVDDWMGITLDELARCAGLEAL